VVGLYIVILLLLLLMEQKTTAVVSEMGFTVLYGYLLTVRDKCIIIIIVYSRVNPRSNISTLSLQDVEFSSTDC